jgi:hypothetical protein
LVHAFLVSLFELDVALAEAAWHLTEAH